MSNIDLSPVETAIYNWLVPAYVPAVIFANQRVPKPSYPYASILQTASAREGGRDQISLSQDLRRAKSVRFTPAVAADATYTVTLGGVAYSYTASDAPTAAEITAGLKAAITGSLYTVTDNAGTLDIAAAAVFLVTVTSNLSWSNLDAGHEITETALGSRRLAFQITFHVDEDNMVAGGAYAWAETVQTSLSLESVVAALWAQGVAVVKTTGLRDMSQVVNGQWESRAVFDVVFRVLVQFSEDTGYIGHVTATGDVDGAAVVFDGP